LTLKDSKASTSSSTGNSWDRSLASIVRVRVDADLTDNVAATIRLLNERYWGNETDNSGGSNTKNSDIDLDLAYVTMKEFLYSPLTLTVGRQELHFGNDMILGDPDTNNAVSSASPFNGNRHDPDLSARKAFDAIRVTLNYDPLVVDGVYAKVRESDLNLNNDTDLWGINANYALNKTTTVEGYWFEKKAGQKSTGARNKNDRVDTIGGRVVTQPKENITFQLEAAYQLGRRINASAKDETTQRRRAWATEAFLTYDMKDKKYSPSVTAAYAYFTGNRGNNRRYTAWDPMYENQKMGDIANALFNQSNAHIAGIIASMKPVEDVTLKGEFYGYWWDKRYGDLQTVATARDSSATIIMRSKKFAGNEVDLTATYDYTEDVQFSLMCGMFFPGASFDKPNKNTASEVIGSMKVTF
jgi:hypothetical protein